MNLVTGATGIVGSHVALTLARDGAQVIAARRKGSDISKTRELFAMNDAAHLFDKLKWVTLDLEDVFSIEDALTGVEVVYHCGGLVSFKKKDRELLYKVNEQGTANLVNTCLRMKNIVLCHVSTVATINNSDARKNVTENLFWKRSGHESDYAISKYNAEREVWRGMEEGLSVVVVNPSIVLSPVFWRQSSGLLFSAGYEGNAFYTEGTTGYVCAGDVARAMITAVNEKQFGERFILAAGNHSFKEILSRIQGNFGRKLPGINAGRTLLLTAMYLEKMLGLFGKEARLTKPMINAALATEKFDGSKARTQLRLEYKPVGECIDEICAYYVKSRKS